jgi:hypothetical protein
MSSSPSSPAPAEPVGNPSPVISKEASMAVAVAMIMFLSVANADVATREEESPRASAALNLVRALKGVRSSRISEAGDAILRAAEEYDHACQRSARRQDVSDYVSLYLEAIQELGIVLKDLSVNMVYTGICANGHPFEHTESADCLEIEIPQGHQGGDLKVEDLLRLRVHSCATCHAAVGPSGHCRVSTFQPLKRSVIFVLRRHGSAESPIPPLELSYEAGSLLKLGNFSARCMESEGHEANSPPYVMVMRMLSGSW